IQAEITVVTASNKNLMEKYEREVVLRKKYHDQLVELRGNIRVLCRVKPVTGSDWEEGSDPPVVWMDPSVDCRVRVMYKGRARSFELDKVFPFQATQEEVTPQQTPTLEGFTQL
ncbi:hypothetical protein chiPu_0024934, partial [Chiloscyllium punctatum]|nr:hypothetical protein [Chiloscyllium punctatum]